MRMRGLTLVEVVVIVVILAVLGMLAAVTLARAREHSRRDQCARQLRSLLTAMWMYSDSPSSNGYLPTYIPPGASEADGMGSLGLLYRQYVNDPRIFACPSDPRKPTPVAMSTLSAWPLDGTTPSNLMKPGDSSYAYNPGHDGNDSVLLMADKKGAGANSDNHGKNAGQNVSHGTSVLFITAPVFGFDNVKQDPNVYARNAELKFEEDSFLRQ